MQEYKFSDSDIVNQIYKNKVSCFSVDNCIIDLREFSKHPEYEQSRNIKVYSNNQRVKRYVNRNPTTNALWYDEPAPTFFLEDEFVDSKGIVFDGEIDDLFFNYDYLEWQYSHFLTDVYPKMWYYPQLKRLCRNLKFGQIRPILNFAYNLRDKSLKTNLNLVSGFAHEITDFYLSHLGFENDFVPLEIGKIYHVKRLYLPVPFTSQDAYPWPERQYEMYNLLKKESKKVKRNFSERVFISRNDTVKNGWFNLRYCVNEEEIAKAVVKVGYESIELMPLNIFEKIKVYSTSKKIIQQIGSNCFNSVFSSENTTLYTLVHPHYRSWIPGLENLSSKNGSKLVSITGGIETLGLDGYPEQYKRDVDQPWKFTEINKLVKLVK